MEPTLQSQDVPSQGQKARKRRHHFRSRNGCQACKKLHVRCDESRPSCVKCLVSKTECQYAAQSVPAKEQKQQCFPGVIIWKLPGQTASDPFDALPIGMELRSRELLHYFAQANTETQPSCSRGQFSDIQPDFGKQAPRIDCVAMNTKEPTAFRNMLIVAGLHFAWKTGNFAEFEKTFLFHRGESIRLASKFLGHGSTRTSRDCMKLVAALSLVESSLGNCPASETHIQGLLSMFNLREAQRKSLGAAEDDEDEILERLLLTTFAYYSAVKCRVSMLDVPEDPIPDVWQRAFTGLWDNLAGMRLLAYYFPSMPAFKSRDIDAMPILHVLRQLDSAAIRGWRMRERTHYVRKPTMAGSMNICDRDDPTDCLGCKSMAAMFHAHHRIHAESLCPEQQVAKPPPPLLLPSSWCGFVLVESFYLRACMGLWNDGRPTEPKLFRRFMKIFKKDIAKSAAALGVARVRDALWFWKVFVTAYAVRVMLLTYDTGDGSESARCAGQNRRHSPTPYWFRGKIRTWSKLAGVVDWADAKAALHEIVWNDVMPDDDLAEQIWTEAVTKSPKG